MNFQSLCSVIWQLEQFLSVPWGLTFRFSPIQDVFSNCSLREKKTKTIFLNKMRLKHENIRYEGKMFGHLVPETLMYMLNCSFSVVHIHTSKYTFDSKNGVCCLYEESNKFESAPCSEIFKVNSNGSVWTANLAFTISLVDMIHGQQ